MSEYASLVESYTTSVRHPDVSGFEVLDVLRLRSRLAEVERELTPAERSSLEAADATFLHNAPTLYRQVSEVTSLEALRREAGVRPSHWWWYLDTLTRVPVA
jgi:hypothetical protein